MALTFLLFFSFSSSSEVYAQSEGEKPAESSLNTSHLRAFYWDVDSSSKDLLPFLKNALSDARKEQVFGVEDLVSRLKKSNLPTPDCLLGRGACDSPFAVAIATLQLSGISKIRKSANGFHVEVVDGRNEVIREIDIHETDAKKAAFGIISRLFDATATVVFLSKPEGASVYIEGVEKGKTPFHVQLPIGDVAYTIQLPNYNSVEGTFSLRNGEIKKIDVELYPSSGSLAFLNLVEGTEILIDGKPRELSDGRIELEPGVYNVEIRKDGYDSFVETLEIQPGETIEKNVLLTPSTRFLRDISADAIARKHFVLRLSFEHGVQQASFQDGRDRKNHTLLGLIDSDGKLGDTDPLRRTLHTNGARLEFLYQFRNVGVSLLSLSLLSGAFNYEARYFDNNTLKTERVKLHSSNRLQFRPLQLNYRFFYKNIVPQIEIGMGIDTHFIDAVRVRDESALAFQRTEAFWTVGFAAQYFFNASFFGTLRYSYQGYFVPGKGADHLFDLGIGFAFGSLFNEETIPPAVLSEQGPQEKL